MFYLRSAQIPSFLSPTLVDRILNIGRAITFIKLCLEKLPKQTNTIGGGSSKKKRDNAVKKSYRMINKNKQLTLYGVVVDKETNENEEEEETEDSSNESEDEEEEEEGKKKSRKNKNKSSTPTNSLALTKKDKSSNKETKAKKNKKKRAIKDAQEDLVLFLQDMNSHFRISLLLEKLRQTGGELNFSKMIYSLSNQLDDKLVRLMRQKFFLKEHLLALKKFMLLGQGDFITCLMDNLGPELKKKAGQLFRHNLLSILETAIRSSNVQYEPAFIVDRLSVRLSESTATDTGWEIFSLDYLIDLPLNAVVHTETMSKYRIAFHMLWRLKRVEWSLTITWKQFLSFSHSYDRLSRLSRTVTKTTNSSTTPRGGGERPPSQQFLSSISLFLSQLKAVFHTANLTRAHMMHVVNNLSAFLMFEVMETTWMSLDQKISEAKSLTEIIVAHDDYLNEILHRSLLSRESELLNIQLQKLLNYILEFCYYEENLVTDAMAYIARQRILYNNLQYQKVMKGDEHDTETVASVGGKSITSALSMRDMTPMMMNSNDPGISRKCN
jgi:hypothetical protein